MFFFGRRTTKMPPQPPFFLQTCPLELLILSSVRLSVSWRIKLTFFDNLPNTTIFAFFKLLQCYNESKKLNLLISIHTLLFHEMWILFRSMSIAKSFLFHKMPLYWKPYFSVFQLAKLKSISQMSFNLDF